MESLIFNQDQAVVALQKSFTNFKKAPKSRLDINYLETRLSLLEDNWTKIQERNDTIIQASDVSLLTTHPYYINDTYNSSEETYIDYKTALQVEINKLAQKTAVPSKVPVTETIKHVNLPKISIPTFSGNYEEWQSFRDLFESLIHDNSTLTDVQRLHYLKGYLSGEAEQLLRHIPITDQNYTVCWGNLVARYNNKRYLTNRILSRFLNQKQLNNESSNGVRQLMDTMNDTLKALTCAGIDVSSWDPIIIHIMTTKLDFESAKMWEQRVCSNTQELPTTMEFTEFLEGRFRSLEFLNANKKEHKQLPERPKVFNITKSNCKFCSNNHALYHCKLFVKESCDNRRRFVQSNNLCFNCLGHNHMVGECKYKSSCQRCGQRHHSLLHNTITENPKSSTTAITNNETDSTKTKHISSHFANQSIIAPNQVLLSTALVRINSDTGSHTLRALLDQGSQASFITEFAANLLGLRKQNSRGIVTGLGNTNGLKIQSKVSFNLQSTHSKFNINIQAYVLSKLTSMLPSKQINKPDWSEFMSIYPLADPGYNKPNHIDLLLGADIYSQILQNGLIKGPPGTLIAQNTKLGWIISGIMPSINHCPAIINMHVEDHSIDMSLKKFWELEEIHPRRQYTEEETKCEELYKKTVARDQDGRYIVKLPFKEINPPCQNGKSRDIALKRFTLLENKFQKNPQFKKQYSEVIHEYLTLNHMEIVEPNDDHNKSRAVYLPHHAVIREDKLTTKLRVVFDASCKGVNGVSLNDDLMVGPTLQTELRHLIMRWRTHPICFIADIVKMYRQIKVRKEDADFQRILWRNDPTEEIKDYRITRVTFGTAAAPYLAVKTLIQVAKDYEEEYSLAALRVINDFYMDDLMSGCQNENEAIIIYNQITELLLKGGFQLQKWGSNSSKLLETIKETKRSADILDFKEDDTVKILGLTWNKNKDQFEYTVHLPSLQKNTTKRQVLSDIARLYDPLGWLAPVIIKAKIFMQRLWIAGINWDEELSPGLLQEWLTFRDQLQVLKNFTITRWIYMSADDEFVELHGFCDASASAYAAVVYSRTLDKHNQMHINLIAARTKVAPIKQISIPRLELCGAQLLANLLIETAMAMNIPKSQLYAWTDSSIVLAWLHGQPQRWKPFVANRVTEILSLLNNNQWAHIDSNQNPADCASRGINPSEIHANTLWLNGPQILQEVNILRHKDIKETDLEAKSVIQSHHNIIDELPVWNKFSTLNKLIRVIAYCRRWRFKVKGDEYPSYLTATELAEALKCCIKHAQRSTFSSEIQQLETINKINRKSKLISLAPFMDEDKIMRVGGRIQQSQSTYDIKHPIILPHDSHLSKLIVADAHTHTLHGGPQIMLNFLRSKYWLLGSKNSIKQHIRQCVTCTKQKASTTQPFMGQLPSARVVPSRPFLKTGVDFAGPLDLRLSKGRGCKSYKGYICIFVCMATKAIHLEAVSDLTSEGFLNAFKRFVARRGHCQEIWSDNGTNFVGASKQLSQLFKEEQGSIIQEVAQSLANNATEWHFIPPHAPNFGGLWEAGVKSTKFHLRRILGNATLTFEELSTVLSQIEACLNSRPISQISSNHEDAIPLTAGHFLIGEPLILPPEKRYEDKPVPSLHRWNQCQKMVQHFWRRWSQEYLTTLHQRFKWSKVQPEPKIGDLVLVKEDGLPPAKWLYGLIEEKHLGPDQLTRVVTLRIKGGKIKRPVSKLCILPII